MGFLLRHKQDIHVVMDVGSDAIRAFAYEAPVAGALPKPAGKFVWDIPASTSAIRLVRKVQESISALMRALARPPSRITVGLGPEIAECTLQSWDGDVADRGTFLSRDDIRASYRGLFEKNASLRRAIIVAPAELLVNGYPLVWEENWKSDEALRRKNIKDVKFMTMALTMPTEAGLLFGEIKNSFGGVAIEYLPLVIAEKEAIVRAFGMRDALIVDVRWHATACIAVKDGRFAGVGFTPFGMRRFVDLLARATGRAHHEAHDMLRRRAQSVGGADVPSVVETAGEWKKFLIRTFDSIAVGAGPLPDQVIVLGPGAELPEIRNVLLAGDWLGAFSHAERPRLRAVDGAAFSGGDTLGGHLAGFEDAGLASLMVYSLYHKPIF